MEMKLKLLLLFAIVFVASACSNGSSSDSGIKGDSGEDDPVLTGTTWYNIGYEDEISSSYDGILQEVVDFLKTRNADSIYSAADEQVAKSDTFRTEHNPSKIIFGKSKCELLDTTFTNVRINKYTLDCTKYTFKIGTYFIDGQQLNITSRELYLGGVYVPLQDGVYYLSKANGGSNYTHEESRTNENVNIIILDFTRTSDNVILSSGNIKYEGTINTEGGEMYLKQYSPEVGERKTYYIND